MCVFSDTTFSHLIYILVLLIMADNKLKHCPKGLIRILAFTTIASFALIITGIILFTFPIESVRIQTTKWQMVMDYEDCLPLNLRYKTCEDYFTDPNEQTGSPYCQCLVDVNTTAKVPGKDIHIHCQLEFNEPEIANTSISTLMEIKSNQSEQCDPYIYKEPSANEMCEGIPDIIFNDEIKLQKLTSSGDYVDLGRFKKSVRWNLVNDSNSVIVSMVSNWTHAGREGNDTLTPGSYRLMVIKYTGNKDIHTRTVMFSSQSSVPHVAQRSNALDIAALVLGVLLLAGSIAAFALRKRIIGGGVKNENMIPAAAPSNTRPSRSLPEENPLSPAVNNDA